MSPGVVLVCDPRVGQARTLVAGVLDALGASSSENREASAVETQACAGVNWAAATVAMCSAESTSGSCAYSDGHDVLLWAGEMLLPVAWVHGGAASREAVAEVVLRRLQAQGFGILEEIDGAFCGAWYEQSRRQWNVFNDKLGLIPVFYAARADRLVIGPTARVVWQATGEPLTLSEEGFCDLLRCENMTDEHTLIEGVNWLKGGHVLRWSPGHCRTQRYWDFRFADSEKCDREEAIEQYTSILCGTMRRHADCRAPLLLGISGGLDSRMLLGMCAEIGRLPLCFTVGWSFSDDVRYGRGLARAAGATHEWVGLEEKDLPERLTQAILATDGLHNVAHMAPAATMRSYLVGHAGAVLLEGYLQGVVGGAYVPLDEDVVEDMVPHQSRWARYRLHAGGDASIINGLLLPDPADRSYRRWQERIDTTWRLAPTDDPLGKAEYVVAASRSGRIDVLGTAMLRDSVWVRCPACDNAVLAWRERTPPRWRRGKQLFLEVIRRQFPKLARVQRTASSGLPVSGNRWLREYCWQKERLHRWWTGLGHPWTRKWGTGGNAGRAWAFATWRATGGLDVLTSANARILNWVRRDRLMEVWEQAVRDPLECGPVMALATAEIMIRHLERIRPGFRGVSPGQVQFVMMETPASCKPQPAWAGTAC
ncbi:MAG TPA: asparagine synthase-related protein [Phycisphaerae bacterium]|nr:asparagine synthase-related protein [Phycisphaerae bacterium]HRR85195.1 asparagine synthase-related protein [Phycisphaerae bacterium]